MTVSRTQWIVLASVFAVVVAYLVRGHPPYGLPPRVEPIATAQVGVGNRRFTVEVARTPRQLQRGLQHRDRLAPDAGMLFVLPRTDVAEFWMKDTLIPLDMVFLDGNGRVVRTHLEVPPCRADPCPSYSSGQPVQYVLELAAGQGEGLAVGDVIVLPPSVTR